MEKYEILDLLKEVSNNSKTSKMKVGCILTKAGIPISYGWNRAPKYCEIENEVGEIISDHEVHAEVVSLVESSIRDFSNCELWATTPPCKECAKVIALFGIKKIHYIVDHSGANMYDLKENKFKLDIIKES